ncbi:class I SAM-dependent methyltransferase [Actinocrispum wychmicini]|uniref:Methyltransferase family protein n=1 Tax=Actinocrispum wychmicini TaxID=1213861 RepID=A0A4R2JHX9_9PSEU|nr:class I SAM-dependent methyltransferase [Actinocrispum wychmicini]TCO58684.1 methyltransferase family protein [Actinocrispum wychmicini]
MTQEANHKPADDGSETAEEWYAKRMTGLGAKFSAVRWAHGIVYKRHVQSVTHGRVLDVGCGIGSNLGSVWPSSVGVDHNEHSIAEARARGFNAFTSEEFHARADEYKAAFDSILCAHVMEHMDRDSGVSVLEEYLPYLKTTGTVALIMPQEAGYKTDPTHVRLVDFDGARDLLEAVGLKVQRSFSWPLPRKYGPSLRSNEFVVTGRRV